MKKIISLILALTMVFALAVTASAADDNTGSITIVPDSHIDPETFSNGFTYSYYKYLDAEISEVGTRYYVLATETEKITKLTNNSQYFVLTPSADGSKYYVTLTETGKDLTVSELMNAMAWTPRTLTEMTYDAERNVFSATNLTPGYYVVHNVYHHPYFILTVGDDVVIDEADSKPLYPKLDKKINGKEADTVDEGTAATFTLSVDIPVHDTSLYTIIHDKAEGITPDLNSIRISRGETEFTKEKVASMVTADPDDGCNFHIKITAYDHDTANSQTAWTNFQITYTGIVQALDKESNDGTVSDTVSKNAAHLEWYDTYRVEDTLFTTIPVEVVASNGNINVLKLIADETPNDDTDNKKLAGAGFVVSKDVTTDGTTSTLYYKWNEATANEIAHVSWVTDIDQATEVKSDANGSVVFEGLAAGTYSVIEKTVPAGYNQAAPTAATIEVNEKSVATNEDVTVYNQTGMTLPSTGGMGTTLFYVLGSLMAVTALVVLVTNKRMRT